MNESNRIRAAVLLRRSELLASFANSSHGVQQERFKAHLNAVLSEAYTVLDYLEMEGTKLALTSRDILLSRLEKINLN